VIPRRKLLKRAPGNWPPLHLDEDEEMRHSLLFPLPAGAAILRDHRLWHSGSPNVTAETRFLPSVELCSQAYAEQSNWSTWHRVLCPKIFASLSARCQAHCRYIVARKPSDVATGVRTNFHCVQATYEKGSGRSWTPAYWPSSSESEKAYWQRASTDFSAFASDK
jgi:hypothetical protein